MHPGLRDAGSSISQFGTIWSNPGRCTFTDCGLVNLVWALARAGSGASEGRAGWQLRARKRRAGSVLKPKQSTGERCLDPMSSLQFPVASPPTLLSWLLAHCTSQTAL
jgi:hypothetical protein